MQKFFLCFLFFVAGVAHAQDADVLHYRFDLQVTDDHDTLFGKAIVTARVRPQATSFSLNLASVAGGKGMQVTAVQVDSVKVRFSHAADVVTVTLPVAKQPDSLYNINIQYKGVPKDGLIISKNKFGDRTFFADNWPNRAQQWIPVVDRPDDKAAFEFIVTAPNHYKVISNGLLQSERSFGNGTTRTHWKEVIPQPTKVMVIGVARFAIKTFKDSPAGVPVSAWVYPQDSAKGFHDYALASSIVKWLSTYVGPYPYKKLANVQSKTIFGGMENASAIFYAENTVNGTRRSEALIAHEIAHQWFGNTATEKTFAHLWLSEGFATYMTHLYMRSRYGQDSFIKRLREDRQEVAAFAPRYKNPIVDTSSNLMNLLNPNSYQKGGWVLYLLNKKIGDSLFQKTVQTYYAEYGGRNADSKDFETVAEKVSGQNLDSFFQQWIYTAGIPQFNIGWTMQPGGQLELNVQQYSKTTYQLPLVIGLRYKNKPLEKRTLQLTKAAESFLMDVPEKPLQIVLDPDTELLFEGKVQEVRR